MNGTLKKFSYIVIFVLACVILFVLMNYYDKFSATWGSIPVIFVAIPVSVLVVFLMSQLAWFKEIYQARSGLAFTILFVGLVICCFTGIYLTEPTDYQKGPNAMSYDYERTRSGNYALYLFGDMLGESTGIAADSVDLDGEAALVLFAIALVAILLLSSAIIPHFWVVAGCVLIAAMGLIIVRDILVEEQAWTYPYR